MKPLAVALLVFCLFGQASAAIISSIERLDQGTAPWLHVEPSQVMTFTGQVWRDSSFLFDSTPQYLHGADQILNSFVDRRDADFGLRVTLAQPALVFLLIDDRVPNIAAEMPWVAALGFTDTGDAALVNQFAGNLRFPFSIYRGNFPAGNLVLGAQNDSSPLDLTGMYSVGAVPVPEPAVASSTLLMAAAALRRRPRSRALRPQLDHVLKRAAVGE